MSFDPEWLTFPQAGLDCSTPELLHKNLKAHIDVLQHIPKEKALKNYLPTAFKTVNPTSNSITFLWLLLVATELEYPPLAEIAEEHILFLTSFDPIQVRYGGSAFMGLCTNILQPNIMPTSVSIPLVARALRRLDPSGSVLTPVQVFLVDRAYSTGDFDYPDLLSVIRSNILFYPGMHNQTPKGMLLSDPSLTPSFYMTTNGGFIPAIKPSELLRYDLICGMIHCARMDWGNAYECFLRCATHPSKDGGVSKIMVHAFKKLILVSLLFRGKVAPLPSVTSGSAAKVYDIIGKPYAILASLFEASEVEKLMAHVQECETVWEQDQNTNLVMACLEAYQKWKIIGLRDIYSKIFITDIRLQTQSAVTGQPCATDSDVESLVADMISSGMFRGKIETTENGDSYLEYFPQTPALTEKDFHEELCASQERIKNLAAMWHAVDLRVSTSKEHVKHIIRMEKSGKKGGPSMTEFGDGDYDDPSIDEDLMEEGF